MISILLILFVTFAPFQTYDDGEIDESFKIMNVI